MPLQPLEELRAEIFDPP